MAKFTAVLMVATMISGVLAHAQSDGPEPRHVVREKTPRVSLRLYVGTDDRKGISERAFLMKLKNSPADLEAVKQVVDTIEANRLELTNELRLASTGEIDYRVDFWLQIPAEGWKEGMRLGYKMIGESKPNVRRKSRVTSGGGGPAVDIEHLKPSSANQEVVLGVIRTVISNLGKVQAYHAQQLAKELAEEKKNLAAKQLVEKVDELNSIRSQNRDPIRASSSIDLNLPVATVDSNGSSIRIDENATISQRSER